MPSSWPSQISPILNLIVAAAPRSVLDIGPGFGKYGVLCREYLEVIPGMAPEAPYPPPRRVTIDCIEICPEYLSPIHGYVYDNVYIGHALNILRRLADRSYNLALLIDVLEHFSSEQAVQLMDQVIRVAQTALVATPTTDIPQAAVFGNEHERHRSHWNRRSLKRLAPASRFFRSLTVSTGHICLVSSDPAALGHIWRRVRLQNWISFRTAMLERLHLRGILRRLFRREAVAQSATRSGRPPEWERT